MRKWRRVNLSLNRYDDADPPWLDDDLANSIRRLSAVLDPTAAMVNMIIVDDSYIRGLNREFRDIDEPTDVISFSYLDDESPAPEVEDDVAGEVYISYQKIEEEAKVLGVEPRTMFLRVGVHGLLHVAGYDHVGNEDAARMEREEKSILSRCLDSAELDTLF